MMELTIWPNNNQPLNCNKRETEMHQPYFESLKPVTSLLNWQTTNNIPSTDVIQLTLTMKVTIKQVVKLSVTVNNSSIQDNTNLGNQVRFHLLIK